MKKFAPLLVIIIIVSFLTGCYENNSSQETKDAKAVQAQQSQYAAAQPVPAYDWSLERHLVIKLYDIRNMKAATHSVWRSDYGFIEGDCPSMGFGIPFDTSLTNPLVATDIDMQGHEHSYQGGSLASVEQPEPNGIFASKNTSATWVMCVGDGGIIEPIYVETKVTTYPYPVTVDYDKNRVKRAGKASVSINANAG